MKRSACFAFAVVGTVAAQAQTFSNVSFNTTVPGATAIFTPAGNSYTANITGFTLGPASVGDIAWIFNFNSSPVPAYNAVTIEIKGTIQGGSLDIIGNEKVFDTSFAPPIEVVNGTINGNFVGGAQPTPFTLTPTFSFTQPVTVGQAQKDILHITSASGTATINSIKQSFAPVPEPATIAAVGIGLAALTRRRKR